MKGRSSPGMLLCFVLAVPVVSPTPPLAAAAERTWEGRAIDLSAEFSRAEAAFDALLERPDRNRRPDLWDDAEARFSAIIRTDPGGAQADEAIYMIGEVNYQRHRVFRERKYLDAAVSAFKRVLATYRLSSRGGDALVRLADIHYYNLDDSKRAYLLYRRAAHDYPDTDASRRARVRMIAMEARSPHYAGMSDAALDGVIAPARAGRPLPSPGAVLGGRRRESRGAARPAPRPTPESVAIEEAAPGPSAVRQETPRTPERSAPHPLLEEGPVPLRSPSDDLPSVQTIQPRS